MKYNFKPFKYSSHNKIVNLVKPGQKVLDIGCASGYLARLLMEKHCQVEGIDVDTESVREAQKYCSAQVLDITQEKVAGKYDAIILGDVLEHLVEPAKILSNLKENLNEGGSIIISLPNIANIYPRLKILSGNFDYEEIGIFDKTHLRFFTRKSFQKMTKESGYEIEKLEYTPIPIYLKFPKFPKFLLNFLYNLLYLLSVLWPTMFAYQFIAQVKRK